VNDIELVVVDDENTLAARVADRLARAARAGESVVLTGGTTPGLAYREAAELERDWSKVDLWWGDERCVPPDHEDSNYGMAKRSLLDLIDGEPRSVHRIKGELGKDRGAAEYAEEVASARLDLLLLGMGPDGHIASLYPNAPTLEQDAPALPAVAELEPFVDRVTLSLPKLRGAEEILFLIAGESKADAVARAFAAEPSPDTPASLVRADTGRTVVILDRAAAAKLPA
jgi:6-phosphogluconolactonase